jgi:hypothetical protein
LEGELVRFGWNGRAGGQERVEVGVEGCITIKEKAMVAPTVPAPTMATLAVVGFGIFVMGFWGWFGFFWWVGELRGLRISALGDLI